jgi:hypothetical protein
LPEKGEEKILDDIEKFLSPSLERKDQVEISVLKSGD